jgi:hypothetical protein
MRSAAPTRCLWRGWQSAGPIVSGHNQDCCVQFPLRLADPPSLCIKTAELVPRVTANCGCGHRSRERLGSPRTYHFLSPDHFVTAHPAAMFVRTTMKTMANRRPNIGDDLLSRGRKHHPACAPVLVRLGSGGECRALLCRRGFCAFGRKFSFRGIYTDDYLSCPLINGDDLAWGEFHVVSERAL